MQALLQAVSLYVTERDRLLGSARTCEELLEAGDRLEELAANIRLIAAAMVEMQKRKQVAA